MMHTTVDLSVKGKWVTVPAIHICGVHIIVKGRWCKVATIADEEWIANELTDPDLCISWLKKNSADHHADLFTFAQKLPDVAPHYNYPAELESTAVVQITSFAEWWQELPQETRKNVRRAEKRGVVTKSEILSDRLINGIVALNNDSCSRQNLPFAHYGKTFDQVARDQATFLDQSEFICAYHNDELIGFVKLVYRAGVASILQMLPKQSHSDKRPANALIAKAVEVCCAKGISHLVYGRLNYGNKLTSTLRDFKSRNGFREVFVPRYYVPLTLFGRICLDLGLYGGLIGILPSGVIAAGVRLRSAWNGYRSTGRAGVAQ